MLAIGIGESLGAGGYERGESESLPCAQMARVKRGSGG